MKCAGVQSPRAPQIAKTKFLSSCGPERSVVHFGMKLHGPDAAIFVGDAGQRIRRNGGAMESRGQFERFVAVAHPHLHRFAEDRQTAASRCLQCHFGMAVFALGRGAHLAAHVMHDEMQSVADAEDRRIELEQRGVGCRRVGVVHRRRAAGEDEADGLVGLDFSDGNRAGEHDGEDVLFADAAGDQLRILRAEVEDNDCLGVHS